VIQIHHPAPERKSAPVTWLTENIGWIIVALSIWLAPLVER
jgi:hypothetical protein